MAESLSPLLLERGYLHNFSRLQNIELQQFQAPSPAGEGWGEDNKINWLYSFLYFHQPSTAAIAIALSIGFDGYPGVSAF